MGKVEDLKVGDRVKAPCGHEGVVVWVSGDGRVVAVKCLSAKQHYRTRSDWRGRVKTYFNPIYFLDAGELGVAKTIVFTGGFFHLIHRGHINLFREAKRLGDYLIVSVHRDECLVKKRGVCAVPLEDRKAVLEAIRYIDEVWVCGEGCDLTEVANLQKLRQRYPGFRLIYAKGGEYNIDNMPEVELAVCDRLGIKVVFGVGGGKVQSSSWIIEKLRGLRYGGVGEGEEAFEAQQML